MHHEVGSHFSLYGGLSIQPLPHLLRIGFSVYFRFDCTVLVFCASRSHISPRARHGATLQGSNFLEAEGLALSLGFKLYWGGVLDPLRDGPPGTGLGQGPWLWNWGGCWLGAGAGAGARAQ